MSDTTSPSSGHLHPLSPSSSMSHTDSAPQSEPTSDEQPDLGAFTTVLRAWTYLQPPPRIPLQTRPTSSSDLQEESTVWNHAPIASYLYSETPTIDLDDVNSVISTEGGRTVEINSETSFDEHSIRDDASVSHLSLPPTGPPIPRPQPKLGIGTSVSRGVGGDGQGTIVVDDLRTPDQTPDSFLVDRKRSGKAGGFRPLDDDREDERGERKFRAYGLGFGFGRMPQGWHGQKHVSGYTSNYEGSQSSFRARKSSEMRGRTTRLEPQKEDNEDSDFNSYAADHQDDEDQNEEDEEDAFPRYRRRSGEFHFHTHTPRYYGRSHTPPRGVLPTHPPRLQGQIRTQPELPVQAQTSHSVSYSSTQNQSLSTHPSTTTTTTITDIPLVPISISAAPSVSPLPVFSSAMSIPLPSVSVSAPLSKNHGLPPTPPPLSSSSASLKSDKSGDLVKRASWEYVNFEEDGDEVVSVSVSEGSSIVGVGVVSKDSGLSVGSGTSFGLGHPFPIAHLPQSTKQLQPITKHPSMNEQQRPQHELVQTRLHVEPDSDGLEHGGGATTNGVLVSEQIAAASTAQSITISTTAIIDDSQSPSLNSIPHPIPRSITPSIRNSSSTPNPELNLDSNPNIKLDSLTNHSKHTHTQSHTHFSNYSHPGFHSDPHVAHIEDMTESELDLDLDDDLERGRDVGVSTVRRVSGATGDALLPSLGYLDEALSFIAEERAKWSAAMEGGAVGAGGSGSGSGSRSGAGAGGSGVDARFPKGGGGKKSESRKVFDHDMDIPKRKRRRKRRQSQPPLALSNSTPGLLELPLLTTQHTADEDGGGPSTSTSSTKRKRIRSSSWSPKKRNSKGKEKEFLIAPPVVPAPFLPPPVLIQGERDQYTAGDGVVFPSRSVELLSVRGHGLSKKDEDGDRTPTNSSGITEDVSGPVNTGPTTLSKKRSKVGKKERERERVKKELMIGRAIDKETVVEKVASRGREVAYEEDDDNESEKDGNDEEEDAVSHDDLSVEDNSSLNNLSLLQPPQSRRDLGRRKKGKDIAHIHSRAGIAGAYKSTPGSPKRRREFEDILIDQEDRGIHGHEGDEDNEGGGGNDAQDVVPDKELTDKKRILTKRRKGLVRVRSVPQLDAEEPTFEEIITVTPGKFKSKKAKSKALAAGAASISALVPAVNDNDDGGVDLPSMAQPQTKRSRLIALAKELRQFFPEQRQELRRVTVRFEKQGMEPKVKGKKAFLTGDAVGVSGSTQMPTKSAPIPVPGFRKSKRNIHRRSGSESAIVDPIESGNDVDRNDVEEDEELDPRGRPPKKGDLLIHVFIDHSNILIGLLSHLKRFPLSYVTAESKRTKRSHPLPTIFAKTTPTVSMSHVTTSALAFAAVKPTSSRPLPNPNLTTSGNGKINTNTSSSSSIPITVPGHYHHRIPLPSFATMSRSFPSGSILNEYPVENDDESQIEEKDVHSDAYEYPQDEDADDLGQITSLVKAWKPNQKEKRSLKHLWHAALVLLLERGRSVTRRVVVTSSPLYQPMDEMERLGYELRVYVRVPDLGDGMDRDRHRDRNTSFGVQSTPTNSVSYSELPAKKSKREILGHVRRISGSTSAESGSSGGGGSGGARNLHPYHGMSNNTPPFGRIKYREQGVDELLQLKLHQALAATDDVPEGSTIVLATGDGNMGQFNEEGFLGPIRTALKRGWKVELYAWEDGLSRAWRREFGEGTEWGRKGMFRVIGMEQFADSLVEVIDL